MVLEKLEDLLQRNRELQQRLDEAEETLRALRNGEVDAVVASGPDGDRVYTLKGADEAYRVMVQNMAEGALTLTREGLILFSNEQFASLLGIPLERVIGSSVQQWIAEEDAPLVDAMLAGSAGGKGEVHLKGPAALVPAQLSANGLLLDGIECVCLIVTDLRAQKRNQEIVASERLAQSILEQAAGAILVMDPEGRIVRASRSSEQLANGAVLLRQFNDVFRLREAGGGKEYTLEEILLRVQRDGSLTGLEATAAIPGGQARDVVLSANLLTGADSERLGSVLVMSDVSGIRRAEEKLRQSEEGMRLILESATHIAIFTLDAHGLVSSWTPGAARLKGYAESEVIGRHVSLFYTEEDRRAGKADSLLRVAGESGVAHDEGWRVKKDGSLFWGEVTINALDKPDGSLTGFSVFLRDFTDRQNAILDRARLIQELEERNRDLERSNTDLEQFAYVVSHDLQEPLRMVSIYTELLSRRFGDAAAAAGAGEFMEFITSGASRMQAMIRDILAFARVNRSDRSTFEQVDLNEAVTRARRNLTAAIAECDAELICEPLPMVMGDISQLALVFQNLIGNALKYRSEERPRIVISPDGDDKNHRVSVRDNGRGIDPKYHRRIFGLFKRLNNAQDVTGTGIGLAISQRIIERHGGNIRVESEPGKGSTFVISIPR